MVTAGMFEHNFGDSEFLTLFLGILSLPYAAAAARPAERRASEPQSVPSGLSA
jgi:hypothetical protein